MRDSIKFVRGIEQCVTYSNCKLLTKHESVMTTKKSNPTSSHVSCATLRWLTWTHNMCNKRTTTTLNETILLSKFFLKLSCRKHLFLKKATNNEIVFKSVRKICFLRCPRIFVIKQSSTWLNHYMKLEKFLSSCARNWFEGVKPPKMDNLEKSDLR